MLLKQFKQWQSNPKTIRILLQISQNLGQVKLGKKINLSFGALVVLTFLVVGQTYLSSVQAIDKIRQTQQVRIPSALASAEAQKELLRMLSDVRGYLATGESEFRDRYQQHRQKFDRQLSELNQLLSHQSTQQQQQQLQALRTSYQKWSSYPDQLFRLRDSTLDNQPALKILEQDGELLIGGIAHSTQQMLQEQEGRSPSMENALLLQNMVEFNSSFSQWISSLRNYLVTREPSFRFEYGFSFKANQQAWEKLQQQRSAMSSTQQARFDQVDQKRQLLLQLPDSMFTAVEGDRYREDLYLLRSQVEPLASDMLDLLGEIVNHQQAALTQELKAGNDSLFVAQWANLLTGFAAMGLGAVLAIFFRRQIADPIQRLTEATTRITAGDFDVNAPVESQDEIGTLATMFNQMVQYLKESRERLETYNRTLEYKVEERTESLRDKNQQLGQAFEELKQAQIQLVQTEKMSSLGQMVAGIAHEINNPVNFIHGNISYASSYAQDLLDLVHLYQAQCVEITPEIEAKIKAMELPFLEQDLSKILSSMQVGTERIREIVKSLRIFSRLDEAEVKNVDIHEGIDSTLMILQSRLKEIEITKAYGELPKIECYAGQLNQVFMNILSNGIDALEELQKKRDPDQISDWTPKIHIRTQMAKDDRISVHIIDNGAGMPEHVKQRLFDPFFTTKEVGKGTGLGMSISHQIITEKHKGQIECNSVLGEGTEFIITIPTRQQIISSIPL
jgi:signal transduction histidine kinase